jgi:hypothetical protein
MNITVKELIERLQGCNPNAKIDFSGMTFYRVKGRGKNLVQIEFNEALESSTETHITFLKSPL